MILQTFQGYLYIMSKSVWKVRLIFSVATAVKAIVYNNVKGEKIMADKKELKDNELKKDLKEEELENVGGGYVFFDRYGSGKWQIISDRTGSVKNDGFLSKEAAQEWAEKTGYGTDEILWDDLDKLRKDFEKEKASWNKK